MFRFSEVFERGYQPELFRWARVTQEIILRVDAGRFTCACDLIE